MAYKKRYRSKKRKYTKKRYTRRNNYKKKSSMKKFNYRVKKIVRNTLDLKSYETEGYNPFGDDSF